MSIVPFVLDLLKRLQRKVLGMVPIVLGALVATLVLSVVAYLVLPFLPEPYRLILEEARHGDWAASRERLVELVDGFGPAKLYAFLGLQVLQVLFAPIPGQLIGLLGGYFFGFWQGLLLSMTGLAIGSMMAMGVGRLLGMRLVRRVVPKAIYEKFDYLVQGGGLWNLFMLFLLPALPDDAICFIAGLTRWPLWQLVTVCLLGRLPGIAVLVFVGASVGGDMAMANVLLGLAMTAALALWLYSDEAEAYFYRLTKRWAADGEKRQ